MIRMVISKHHICSLTDLPRQASPRETNLDSFLCLRPSVSKRLLTACAKVLQGYSPLSQISYLSYSVSRLGEFIKFKQYQTLPLGTVEWQDFLMEWFGWYLSTTRYTASLRVRSESWDSCVHPLILKLKQEKIIPREIVVPKAKLPNLVVNSTSPIRPTVIGAKPAKPTEKSKPINKTIAGPIFWKSDEAYFEEIELTLRMRNKLVGDSADDFWLRLVKDYRIGRNLIRRVPKKELSKRIRSNDWLIQPLNGFPGCGAGARITHPKYPNSERWLLAIFKHILRTSEDPRCFHYVELTRHPSISSNRYWSGDDHAANKLRQLSSLRGSQISILSRRLMFCRFIGLLGPVDAAVACVILIQEHPNFNPHSLYGAELIDANGKEFFLAGEDGSKQIFSVDKPRAGERKYAALSWRAIRVLRHVLRATKEAREILRRAGSPLWKLLFLGVTSGGIGHMATSAQTLNGSSRASFVRFYPELVDAGIEKGTFDFAKLRTTQGVLDWFDTGSVVSASKKLGNSYQICLESYIPKPMIDANNERIIRRFQNTLILIAARNEPYLLEVTDFSDVATLQEFIVQILQESPEGSSPIIDFYRKSHKNIQELLKSNTDPGGKYSALLTVRLHTKSLAFLYAYRNFVKDKIPHSLHGVVDPKTGLSPRHFLDLAKLISQSAENENVSDVIQEVLSLSALRKIHFAAKKESEEIFSSIKSVRINLQWDDRYD